MLCGSLQVQQFECYLDFSGQTAIISGSKYFKSPSKGCRASDVRWQQTGIQLIECILWHVQLLRESGAHSWAAQVYQPLGSYLQQGLRPVKYKGVPRHQKWSCCS